MFAAVAGFEFRHQVRQPIFWIGVAVFGLLTFGLIASDNVSIGGGGNVHENSPFTLLQAHGVFSIFFLFVLTAFVANVVVRDDETGFGPIVRSTHVGKATYLYGRFLGAFAAALLAFAIVPLMLVIGAAMPWLDPETLGPLRPGDYLYAYGLVALPNLFFAGALLFALATVSRSMIATYLGLIALLVAYFVSRALSNRPGLEETMALVDPFGSAALGLVTEYWTAAERNTRLPAIGGVLLGNRLLVTGLGLAALAAAYLLFRFDTVGVKGERKGRKGKAVEAAPAASVLAGARGTPRFDASTGRSQFWAQTRFEIGQTVRSPAFGILLALFLLLSVPQLWFATTPLYDARMFPVTRVMIETLRGTFALGPLIIAIYYAGELVWRERDRRTHEIVGSAPVSDWAFLLPKVLAITLVLFVALLVAVVAACGVQLARGYTDLELDKYLAWWVVPEGVSMFLIATLAVFLQSVAPHKFVGWLLMLVYLIGTLVLSNLGFEHNLGLYGGYPVVPLSDMNGTGRPGEAQAWFLAYWSACAVALLALSYALWSRGASSRVRDRLRALPRRLAGTPGLVLAGALVAFAGLGGWIYINTNVWNAYRTSDENERWAADYEKELLRYEAVPQPKIADVRLAVDIRPKAKTVRTEGRYILENRTGAPLKALHVRFERDLDVVGLAVEGGRPERTYDRFNYRIFALDTPMQPGERRALSFTTVRSQRGFTNSAGDTKVVENGTFLNNGDITPFVGMGRDALLSDRSVRRKYGLPRELRPPKLEDAAARRFNGLRRDSDWVTADIRVTTDADQTPVAPGVLVSETVRDGRRSARFRAESPINHFFSIQSARYQVRRGTHAGIALSVLYHPEHPWTVERMERAMRASFDYMQPAFGPYQFRQARILEFPYGEFAQAFAGTVPYSENLGFLLDYRLADRDRSKIDMVTYVTAHEIAHQWWGHQLVPAEMQGGTLLVETLAQYSALMVMERMYGPDQIRKFLKFELDSYLRARGGEGIEELPLLRVENQAYIHYRKGSLVMYRLKEVIGEEAVNRALRRVLAQYAFKAAPYPTSRDLISAIRAEAGPEHQALITDLFERITLYDVKTDKVVSTPRPDGRFDVVLTVTAKKLYADGEGDETETPLTEWVDVGLFADKPGEKGFDKADVIALERRILRSGEQTLRFVASRAPEWGGADPYNTLIDRNGDDNLQSVD
jgi:aminopeptidase N/ABC-type transport system involved in multi-copper enzyme maturation permease subunit